MSAHARALLEDAVHAFRRRVCTAPRFDPGRRSVRLGKKKNSFAVVLDFWRQVLVYVGEPRLGVCADDAFFDALDGEWLRLAVVPLPRWPGLRDAVYIYHRRDEANTTS